MLHDGVDGSDRETHVTTSAYLVPNYRHSLLATGDQTVIVSQNGLRDVSAYFGFL
jgi:hypothetical protein